MATRLNIIAGKINAHLREADNCTAKAEDHRRNAAMLIGEAEQRIEAGEAPDFVSIYHWCDAKLEPGRNGKKRSEGDIRKLLRVFKATDPEGELARQRKANADSQRRSRAARKAVTRVTTTEEPEAVSSPMTTSETTTDDTDEPEPDDTDVAENIITVAGADPILENAIACVCRRCRALSIQERANVMRRMQMLLDVPLAMLQDEPELEAAE